MSDSISRVNSYVSRNNIKKNSFSDIDDINNEFPIKTCFNSFLCEYGNPNKTNPLIRSYGNLNKKNEIVQKIYTKRKAINSLYKIKDTVFSSIIGKPVSLKYLELGMKKIFFGPEGFITNKVNFLKKVYKKKRDFHIGLDTRIYAGNLDYLDLRTKNSYNNRIDEAKRAYFARSSNFALAENNKKKRKDVFKNKRNKIENKSSLFLNKFNLTTSSDDIKKICLNEPKKIHSFSNKEIKKNFSSQQQKSKMKSKIKLKLKHKKLNLNLFSPIFNDNNRLLSGLTSSNHYCNIYKKVINKTKINQKIIKQTKNQLKQKIKSINEPLSDMESDLNSFLDNSNTYKRLYEIEPKDDKIKQDIEIISDIKIIDEKSKVKASNKLKEEIDNDKFRFSILRLSDGIKNLNEDTALKLAHNITHNYIEETQGSSYITQNGNFFKKNNYNAQLRNLCSSNLKKMEKMAFSLDLLKNKFNLRSGCK